MPSKKPTRQDATATTTATGLNGVTKSDRWMTVNVKKELVEDFIKKFGMPTEEDQQKRAGCDAFFDRVENRVASNPDYFSDGHTHRNLAWAHFIGGILGDFLMPVMDNVLNGHIQTKKAESEDVDNDDEIRNLKAFRNYMQSFSVRRVEFVLQEWAKSEDKKENETK